MRRRVSTILAAALLCLAPTASLADLAPYSQDFEGLVQSDPGALAADGWLVFANVWNIDPWYYDYGYGPFPAPNGGPGFSGIDIGQGGPEQGDQQLVVYNDYNNGDHANGRLIEANVFQEQIIGAADIGSTWLFKFDAKRGNIGGASTARAFIKTLHPTQFWLSRFIWKDMTNLPNTWVSDVLSIDIAPDLEGHILQIGFLNTATAYEGSGIFYDNLEFLLSASLDIKPGSCPNPANNRNRGLLSAALLGTGNFDVSDVDVDSLRLEGVAPFLSNYEDVAAPFEGDLCGCGAAGPDGMLDLTLKFRNQDIINAIGSSPIGEYQTLTLTGALLDGTPFEAQDCVVFVGGGGRGGDDRRIESKRDQRLTPGGRQSTDFRKR